MTVDAPPKLYRPCWAEINRSALRRNFKSIKSCLSPQTRVLAVVKANAYGHGIVTAAEEAIREGAVCLGVASVEEGMVVRAAGIQTPILILGGLYPFDHFPVLFEKNLTPTIASREAAEALDQLAKRLNKSIAVHLKIDSGFGRIGVSAVNGLGFVKDVAGLPNLIIEGIYTHFASSDIDPDYTRQQTLTFQKLIDQVRIAGIHPTWVHMANSAALLQYPETHSSLVRPGLAYYGIPPYAGAAAKIPFEPVMSLKSRVIFNKMLPVGGSVSYARTWIAKRPSRIVTLAIGYADGLPRLLSNRGQALLGGRRLPIIGRITMDMTMVDATDLPECRVGDEAVLIGTQGSERIAVEDVAAQAQTNPYEILCGISARVPRIING